MAAHWTRWPPIRTALEKPTAQGDDTMKTKQNFFIRFWRDVRGISSVEYALLLAFVATGIITAAGALSLAVQGEMTNAADCLTSAALCN